MSSPLSRSQIPSAVLLLLLATPPGPATTTPAGRAPASLSSISDPTEDALPRVCDPLGPSAWWKDESREGPLNEEVLFLERRLALVGPALPVVLGEPLWSRVVVLVVVGTLLLLLLAPAVVTQPRPQLLKRGRRVAAQPAVMPRAGSETDQQATSLLGIRASLVTCDLLVYWCRCLKGGERGALPRFARRVVFSLTGDEARGSSQRGNDTKCPMARESLM